MRWYPGSSDRGSHGGMRSGGPLSASAGAGGRAGPLALRKAAVKPVRCEVIDLRSNVQTVIEAFARGEIVVVTDDDDRENEGDLVLAAVHATPEKMAFIIRNTCGIVCAPLPIE